MSVGGGQQTLADMDDTVLIVKWQSQWVELKRKRQWTRLTFSWNLSRSKAVMANMLAPGGHIDTTFTHSNRLSVLSLPCHMWAFTAWRIYGDAHFFHPMTTGVFRCIELLTQDEADTWPVAVVLHHMLKDLFDINQKAISIKRRTEIKVMHCTGNQHWGWEGSSTGPFVLSTNPLQVNVKL